MRLFIIALVLAVAAAGGVATPPSSAHAAPSAPALAPATAQLQQPVDDNDDTRVEVQLVVLGAAVSLVVGVGVAAYLLRRRLGLVAPAPDAPTDAHH